MNIKRIQLKELKYFDIIEKVNFSTTSNNKVIQNLNYYLLYLTAT